jgi:hypothetical protein
MQDLAFQLIAALSAHNWLLLTTIISALLLMIAHIPAVDQWMGQRSQWVRPLWPVLCAGLAELSTAAANKTAIIAALVNWGLVSIVALAGAYSKFLAHAGNVSLPNSPVVQAINAAGAAPSLDVIPPAPPLPIIRDTDRTGPPST